MSNRKTSSSQKKNEKSKSSLIFRLFGSIGLLVIVVNCLQVLFVSSSTKKQSVEEEIANLELLGDTIVDGIENRLHAYQEAVDFYVKSDVAELGDVSAFADWLLTKESDRDDDFDYVMVAGPDGVSYSDIGVSSQIGTRPYFKAIMYEGKDKFIGDPVISKTTGEPVLHIARALKSNGKTFAVVAAVVNIKNLDSAVNSVKIGAGGYAFLLASDGLCISHPNQDFVMKSNFVTTPIAGHEDFATVASKIISKERGVAWVKSLVKGKDLIIYRGFDSTDWGFALSVPANQVYNLANKISAQMGAFSFAAIVLLVVVGGLLMVVSLKPLKVVEKAIVGIASGNADLTQRIEINSNNEIGSVVMGFNSFIEKLQAIIRDVKSSKEELGVAGEDMSATASDTASAITQIIANIESVRHQIVNQSSSVEETAGAVNQIASNIESLEHMIENQTSGISQASAAVEQMIGNISSVNQSVDKMADSFEELQSNANTGFSKQQDVNDRINQIEQQSAMLQEANTVIQAIAEQTNLLAMNAAIEAAHAGEAGKGFSVVADEIRKLSETSSQQSKTIGDQLNNIRNSISSVVSASQDSSAAFEMVSRKIHDTDQLVTQIKSAMDEQNEGSRQISTALHSMNDSSMEVRNASAEMSEGNRAILEEVRRLQDATSIMKDSMDEMQQGATKINETGAALSGISHKVQESIEKIGVQIDQFKV